MLFQLSFLDALNEYCVENKLALYTPTVLGGRLYQLSQSNRLRHETTSIKELINLGLIGRKPDVLNKLADLAGLMYCRLVSCSLNGYKYDIKSNISVADASKSRIVFTYGHNGILPSPKIVNRLKEWITEESILAACNRIYSDLGIQAVLHLRMGDINSFESLGLHYIETASATFSKVLVVSNKPKEVNSVLDSKKYVTHPGQSSLQLDLALLEN